MLSQTISSDQMRAFHANIGHKPVRQETLGSTALNSLSLSLSVSLLSVSLSLCLTLCMCVMAVWPSG